jgi:hypothetical protein
MARHRFSIAAAALLHRHTQDLAGAVLLEERAQSYCNLLHAHLPVTGPFNRAPRFRSKGDASQSGVRKTPRLASARFTSNSRSK